MTAHTGDALLTAQRALACSLLDEALTLLGFPALPGTVPALRSPKPPGQPGHPIVWDDVTIPAALRAFVARQGRAPSRAEWRQATRHQLPARNTAVTVYGSL